MPGQSTATCAAYSLAVIVIISVMTQVVRGLTVSEPGVSPRSAVWISPLYPCPAQHGGAFFCARLLPGRRRTAAELIGRAGSCSTDIASTRSVRGSCWWSVTDSRPTSANLRHPAGCRPGEAQNLIGGGGG